MAFSKANSHSNRKQMGSFQAFLLTHQASSLRVGGAKWRKQLAASCSRVWLGTWHGRQRKAAVQRYQGACSAAGECRVHRVAELFRIGSSRPGDGSNWHEVGKGDGPRQWNGPKGKVNHHRCLGQDWECYLMLAVGIMRLGFHIWL